MLTSHEYCALPGLQKVSQDPKVPAANMKRAWRDRAIPVIWQRGCIILIPKSSTKDLSDPSEFRPIALLNAEGRLFFTLMVWRLSDCMISNGYLDSTVQKGFTRDVSGCVEHSETIYRAALDARTHGRDLCHGLTSQMHMGQSNTA